MTPDGWRIAESNLFLCYNHFMFDTLTYAKKLREAGVPEKQAEVQAETLSEIIESNLATKTDVENIRRDMKELETSLKRDMKAIEAALKVDIDLIRRDMKEMELKLEGKISESKSEIVKWCVGSMFASVGLFAAIVKLMG